MVQQCGLHDSQLSQRVHNEFTYMILDGAFQPQGNARALRCVFGVLPEFMESGVELVSRDGTTVQRGIVGKHSQVGRVTSVAVICDELRTSGGVVGNASHLLQPTS